MLTLLYLAIPPRSSYSHCSRLLHSFYLRFPGYNILGIVQYYGHENREINVALYHASPLCESPRRFRHRTFSRPFSSTVTSAPLLHLCCLSCLTRLTRLSITHLSVTQIRLSMSLRQYSFEVLIPLVQRCRSGC